MVQTANFLMVTLLLVVIPMKVFLPLGLRLEQPAILAEGLANHSQVHLEGVLALVARLLEAILLHFLRMLPVIRLEGRDVRVVTRIINRQRKTHAYICLIKLILPLSCREQKRHVKW